MLTCKEFLQSLSDYLDDTADAPIRARIEAHINSCPNCFVVYDTTKRTLQVYKGMEPQVIPGDVQARLMRALEKKMAGRASLG